MPKINSVKHIACLVHVRTMVNRLGSIPTWVSRHTARNAVHPPSRTGRLMDLEKSGEGKLALCPRVAGSLIHTHHIGSTSDVMNIKADATRSRIVYIPNVAFPILIYQCLVRKVLDLALRFPGLPPGGHAAAP